MWNPLAELVTTWQQLFNPSVRKAWHLNLDTSGLIVDGQFLEASAVGARALALNEALYGPTHPQIAESMENLAFALNGLDKIEQAKPLFERAWEMYEACYGQRRWRWPARSVTSVMPWKRWGTSQPPKRTISVSFPSPSSAISSMARRRIVSFWTR